MAQALDRVRDYLTMRAESESAAKVASDDKVEIARALTVVVERRRAGEVLWSGACPAQAWRTMKESFEIALTTAGKASGAGSKDDVLRALALRGDDAERVSAASSRCETIATPSTDAEVTELHVAAFPVVREATLVLERILGPLASDPKALHEARRRRQIVVALVSLLVLASIGFAIRMQFRTWVVASGVHASAPRSPRYDAENVIDRAPEGEWLLPDSSAGWIDVHYAPSRTISRVSLLNPQNIPYYDRGTKDFAIELYGKGQLLKTVDGTLPPIGPNPKTQTFEVGRTRGVDRLRIVVKTWYGNGGGLAEISVD